MIVAFESEVELDDDWDDGTGWMGSLISLRADLLRGDFRCLYLGWLSCVENGEFSARCVGASRACRPARTVSAP